MPELPDVEILRRYFDATSLHQEIEGVQVHTAGILRGISTHQLAATLRGGSFQSTRRHGKYLFAKLDDGRWLALHFGMTGRLKYFKDVEAEPEHGQMLVTFTNGYHLAYVAPRKLGTIELIDSVDVFVTRKQLGPDILADGLDRASFLQLLSGRRGMIKSALMDQQLMAGIGNVYSDEILFQEGIYPRTQVKKLDGERLSSLYSTMLDVLNVAIERGANPEEYPNSYLTPHRGRNGTCPRCGQPLSRVKVSGRSAYYCPNRQGDGREGG
jgi:formamidopyrimidine-DNA glycosylase